MRSLISLFALLLFTARLHAETWSDFPLSFDASAPGVFAADAMNDQPAGASGFVVAKGDHFFIGGQRIRFWGVNFTFGNCFPEHAIADATALRLARFGVNAVRFHHMDNQPEPRGIFADAKLETLSPRQLEKLDYFIAALKKQGIYSNINLHVSRDWSRAHHWPRAEELPSYDKMLGIFHPELIAAQKQYARDLLTHVNPYTKTTYANEPAVAMVEITNEDSLFMWGADEGLRKLPPPYSKLLQQLWNAWLVDRYHTRDAVQAAWSKGSQPAGAELLNPNLSKWNVEQHASAKMSVRTDGAAAVLNISNIDGTDWHLQFNQRALKVTKNQYYTLRFRASADKPTTIAVALGQAHDPFNVFGSAQFDLTTTPREFVAGFTASADDANARVSFTLGQAVNTIRLSDVTLKPGGQRGLGDDEDPIAGTVACKGVSTTDTKARSDDWYSFLEATETSYFASMRDYLHKDLGVKALVTGTIVFGPRAVHAQEQMDFVDAHAYWDHPHFPRRPWDMKDWTISDRAMVDHPEKNTLKSLAATRVKGKPYTVTEYNQPIPNSYAAECVPEIATWAALNDWDAVFLFDYSPGSMTPKDARLRGFFELEGDPTKMPLLPVGARIFRSNAIQPLTSDDQRVKWTATKPGTGQLKFTDNYAAVFIGFPGDKSVKLGPVTLEDIQTPFVVLTLVPADASETLASADRLLLTATARVRNTDWRWSTKQHMLDHWGKSPTQIEPVRAKVKLPPGFKLYRLDEAGKRAELLDRAIGEPASVWYELSKH